MNSVINSAVLIVPLIRRDQQETLGHGILPRFCNTPNRQLGENEQMKKNMIISLVVANAVVVRYVVVGVDENEVVVERRRRSLRCSRHRLCRYRCGT